MAVPRDDKYPSDAVPACSACGSKAYDVPGNIIQELVYSINKLLKSRSGTALDVVEAQNNARDVILRVTGKHSEY